MRKQKLKKLLLIIAVLLAVSCSSDDSVEAVSQQVLVIKKIVETQYYSGGDFQDIIRDFTYENEQLVFQKMTIPSETYPHDYITKYIYEGEKVIQTIDYIDEEERFSKTYVYDGDFMKQIIPNERAGIQTDFTYTNGVLASAVSGYFVNEHYVWTGETSFNFISGNLADKTVESNSTISPVTKTNYRFDNKKNPGKFMNKSLRYLFSKDGFDLMSQNNVVSSQEESTAVYPQSDRYEIIYNEYDYPVEIKRIDNEGNLNSKIKIEYQ